MNMALSHGSRAERKAITFSTNTSPDTKAKTMDQHWRKHLTTDRAAESGAKQPDLKTALSIIVSCRDAQFGAPYEGEEAGWQKSPLYVTSDSAQRLARFGVKTIGEPAYTITKGLQPVEEIALQTGKRNFVRHGLQYDPVTESLIHPAFTKQAKPAYHLPMVQLDTRSLHDAFLNAYAQEDRALPGNIDAEIAEILKPLTSEKLAPSRDRRI